MMRWKKPLQILAGALALGGTFAPALAEEPVRIGIGYGLAFLPIYVCEDLRLVEKQAKAAHLDFKANFQRFASAVALDEALAAGKIDMAPFGTAPLLAAWAKAKDTPSQVFAVSGITSLPLTLLSNQPNIRSLGDLKPSDQIAVPTLSSPQMFLLRLQSEKTFGQYDRLRGQVVALPHGYAIAALMENSAAGKEPAAQHVAAYFSSPPFTQLALRDPNIHAVLSSSDVMGGKSSFLIMGATRAFIEARPLVPEVLGRAIDEAARLIRDDPRRAAQIYLTHEPSGTLNGTAAEAVIRDIKDEFGSAVYGVQAMADFMARHGELKSAPRSWKEIVAPALLNSPSS